MKILGIDSTAKTATVALTEDETLLGLITLNAKNTQSETLLPGVESLLRTFHITPRELDLITLTRGPGSFTGVRIGAATAKGLAFAHGDECDSTPIAALSTLEALAYNFAGLGSPDAPLLLVPVMDARRSQLYTACFSSDGRSIKRESEDAACSLDELAESLATRAGGRELYFMGDGYSITREYFAAQGSTLNIRETPELLWYANGYSVARAGLAAYQRGECVSERELAPSYLRSSQAERERGEKSTKTE